MLLVICDYLLNIDAVTNRLNREFITFSKSLSVEHLTLVVSLNLNVTAILDFPPSPTTFPLLWSQNFWYVNTKRSSAPVP